MSMRRAVAKKIMSLELFKKYFQIFIGKSGIILTPEDIEWSLLHPDRVIELRDMLDAKFAHLKGILRNKPSIWEDESLSRQEQKDLEWILTHKTWNCKKNSLKSRGDFDCRQAQIRDAQRATVAPCKDWIVEWRRCDDTPGEEDVELLSFKNQIAAQEYVANRVYHSGAMEHCQVQDQEVFMIDGEIITIRPNR